MNFDKDGEVCGKEADLWRVISNENVASVSGS